MPGRQRQLCEQCCPGVSKTKCTYCRKEKLYLKDYPLPDVPSSHWLGRGLTDEYIQEVKDFLRAMQVTTLMLRSPDEVDEYRMAFLQHDKTQLRHDDALVPHWQQFTNALESYDGIFDEKQLYHSYRRCCFRLAGIELHSSVIDMLGPALATPSDAERTDTAEGCSDRAEGNSLFVLAKICLLDGNSGSTKAYRLDFSGNSMSSSVATHIADVIASNSSRLVKLNLTDNQLTDSDAQAIGQALRSNTTLERLCVQGNDFTQVGVAAIRDAVISPGCTFQAVLNSEHMVSIDLPYSSGKLYPDFRRKYCYNNELTDVAEIEQRKICYIFASRHGSGTDYQLLCEELGDLSTKLLPFGMKRVFDCSYEYFAGNYSVGKLDWCSEEQHVPPLSIAHEILRSWELAKHQDCCR
ncbi:hypothetical protein THAOC_37254 [Thalassiosira oceanica]|uniref:Uncharacterized protein n=1 Tax=Thalassiosira oceanica TaxID=159749 RepID=K0QZ20_THAOC|nr:hypothetical protein THAOC_37254 [Thalassiosira oceanica]|eukprot:EJK44225.1 hypothetical protein THAOC_37254 [Thalassiosira oceanica]